MSKPHQPVMLAEVLDALEPQRGGLFVDCTLGAAGHAQAILDASGSKGVLLGLDRDQSALELASKQLDSYGSKAHLRHTTFDKLDEYIFDLSPQGASGILVDLGVSSMQFDQAQRGFSFRFDAKLDMRMGNTGPSAADLIQEATEAELINIIRRLGEEPFAKRIARALVAQRQEDPILTTGQLASLVEKAIPAKVRRKRKLHPATRTFMALRLVVNDELGQLERFLEKAPSCLAEGGRLCVISYHSLEDRRVKKAMFKWANPCTCPPELPICACGKKPLVTLPRRKAISASLKELEFNPRSRSARLRVAVRTGEPAL